MIESTFSGKRIVVTRPRAQAKELQRALEERGAKCVVVPLIEISQPDDEGFAFEQAMRNVSDYEWVICTSANGASRVAPYLSSGATCPTGLRPSQISRTSSQARLQASHTRAT